ncbi:transporter family protein [Abditibacterium utsteinense]|uniref:Transporter family protein n=1 Tax=Abditibacterium utsteinense TaxID=1960156 RepID=A0A2S8SSD4_9BACT|nr:EamA family transporter [Abditibacterium utsteinense]PQV63722.1 transporter family protein [Abditibacterium utsteinense]
MWKYFALGSAFFAALTAILSKIGVKDVPSNLATAIRTVVILLVAWGLVFARHEAGGLRQISRNSLLFLVLSGVATGLSWLCYFRALHDGPASIVAPIDKLSLPLVILFAGLFLGEKLTSKTALGVAFICLGTFVLVYEPQKSRPKLQTGAGVLPPISEPSANAQKR